MTVLDNFRLDHKVVAVTGAGRGLGAAAALAVAEAGALVVVTGRMAASVENVAGTIRTNGLAAEEAVLDVTCEESVASTFEMIANRHGGIDGLINNAGVEHEASALQTGALEFEHVLRTNLTGSFLCAQAFARLTPRSADRAIVNIGSLIAEKGVKGQIAYGASKAGILSITRTLALELAPHGVRVNTLCPGYFATDMPAAVLEDPSRRERLVRRIPLGRVGDPAEIGPPIVFLLSRASRYMTGASVYFDGGFNA